MQFVFGPPPNNPLFNDELAGGEWHSLRMLPLWAVRLATLPMGVVISLIVFVAWVLLTPSFDINFAEPSLVVPVVLATMSLGTLLQIAAHPLEGFFRYSVIGFWPSRLLLYTACTCELTKQGYLRMLALPFLVMALGPLAFVMTTQLQSGWLVFVSCLAAMAFGMNAAMALPAAWQIPANARVDGIGFQIYWRRAAS